MMQHSGMFRLAIKPIVTLAEEKYCYSIRTLVEFFLDSALKA